MSSLNRFVHAVVPLSGTVSVDPPSIGAAAVGSVAVTIAGLKATDIVMLEPPAALETTLIPKGWVVADGQVTIYIYNAAGTVDGTARNWTYKIIRSYT